MLVGLADARMGQLRGLDGKPIDSKPEADAEAMARLPDGSWLVAFERRHRLWRYSTLTATPLPVEGPADIGRQPGNGGIEALAALADGTVIAISEEYSRQAGTVVGWIGKPETAGPLRLERVQLRDGSRLQADRAGGAAGRIIRHAGARLPTWCGACACA